MNFKPSIYQESIIQWVLNPEEKNGICNAVAGSGKSTTLKLVAIELMNQGIEPRDIKIIVFGKQNQLDLVAKFGEHWKHSISTLHSIGYQALLKEIGNIERVDNNKYKKIGRELGYLGTKKYPGKLIKNKAVGDETQFLKLFDLARQDMGLFEPCSLERLVKNYGSDEIYHLGYCSDAIKEIASKGEELAWSGEVIDYIDMVWLPTSRDRGVDLRFLFSAFVLVDECQDLNLCQIELSRKLVGDTGRLLFVGDPNQAIFGFAGARNDSYEIVKEAVNAIELPLSLCYRCPKSHIKLVNEIFPDIPIRHATDAIEGKIEQVEEDAVNHKEGDLIISRKTAPLIRYCLKLISEGLPAKVKGRAIGSQLIKEINSILEYVMATEQKEAEYSKFLHHLECYEMYKKGQWDELDYRDKLIETLEDELDAVAAIYNSLAGNNSFKVLKDKTKELFTDNDKIVTLCTVHRAKGLEAERVFILEPDDMPLVWCKQQLWEYQQEKNLLYVALTRSKSELYLLDKAAWFREGRDN